VVTSVDQQLIKKTLESEPEQDLAHLRLLGLSPRAWSGKIEKRASPNKGLVFIDLSCKMLCTSKIKTCRKQSAGWTNEATLFYMYRTFAYSEATYALSC